MVYESQLLKSLWWKSDTLEMAAEIWVADYYCYFLKIQQSFDPQINFIPLQQLYKPSRKIHARMDAGQCIFSEFLSFLHMCFTLMGVTNAISKVFTLAWHEILFFPFLYFLFDAEIEFQYQDKGMWLYRVLVTTENLEPLGLGLFSPHPQQLLAMTAQLLSTYNILWPWVWYRGRDAKNKTGKNALT